MSTTPKPKPSLDVAKKDVPGVLSRANIMQVAFVAAIAMFPSPPLSMAAFLLLIQAAAAAQTAAESRAKGLTAIRATKVDTLWTAMKSLRLYVEGLCDVVDAITATAMIGAAGLVVAGLPAHTKDLVSATLVPATGVVRLSVNKSLLVVPKTAKKTSFTWAWSIDGGKTWSAPLTTSYTEVDVPGLGPATYAFRVFATVGKVVGEWTQPVGLTIH